MALTRLLPVLILILFAVGRTLGQLAVVGDSFKFATNKTCRNGADAMELKRAWGTDRFTPVAKLVRGVWTPEGFYTDRIEHISPSALILKHVKFNDAGNYEFTCGNKNDLLVAIKLKVVIPFDINVTLGEGVKLPCFSFTEGVSIKSIKWTLNGSLVLEWHLSTARISPTPSVEQDLSTARISPTPSVEQDLSTARISPTPLCKRASLARDWHLTGDLSLHLERVQLEDQGEFVCHIMVEMEKEERGSPGSVKLTVHNPHQGIRLRPPEGCATPGAPEERPIGAGTIISITLNVVLFILAVIFLIFWLRSRRPADAGGGQNGQGRGEERESVIGYNANDHQGNSLQMEKKVDNCQN